MATNPPTSQQSSTYETHPVNQPTTHTWWDASEFFPFLRNTSFCQSIPRLYAERRNGTWSAYMEDSLEGWEAGIIFLAIGICSALLAKASNYIRNAVYGQQSNLDTDFDAGGKVSLGLTATTIVSQWTWAATLLQSSAVASKYGISGPFWYAAGATIQVLLFAMISVELRIRAPGAKTFLQVVRARFGKHTHIVFCGFALLTNIIVTAMLMLGGAAVLTRLVPSLSVELSVAFVTTVIGTYTYIGGLGATFYVSYCNTAVIYVIMLVFLVKVYHEAMNQENPLGSLETMYELISCSSGPTDNEDQSYLTLVSYQGLMFGIINIVGNFGTVFVDQSYWQSSVAAKPKDGVWGFLTGGLVWFAVPFTFATTMGLAYIALSAIDGVPLLNDDEVSAGLVVPIVAQRLMGKTGEVLVVILLLMAVTSTGSAEIIAVTSILVYDVYQLYLKPYRLVFDANTCILCGQERGRKANPLHRCKCISMTYCANCSSDDTERSTSTRAIKPAYKCKIHGAYRTYSEFLIGLKNWCIMWVSLAIVPLSLGLSALNVSLGWVYLFMGVLIGSAVIPITLCMFWPRLTGVGMVAGSISGTLVGLCVWLAVGSTYPGGLNNFIQNTGAELSMLCGNVCAIMTGGLVTVVVSLTTNRHYHSSNDSEIWESTRDIDNPLTPWTELYARELQLTGVNELTKRPSLEEVATTFRGARWVAYITATIFTLLLIIIWPAITASVGVFDISAFTHWLNVSQAWGVIATMFILIMPLVSETMELRQAVHDRKQVHDMISVGITPSPPPEKAPAPPNSTLHPSNPPRSTPATVSSVVEVAEPPAVAAQEEVYDDNAKSFCSPEKAEEGSISSGGAPKLVGAEKLRLSFPNE